MINQWAHSKYNPFDICNFLHFLTYLLIPSNIEPFIVRDYAAAMRTKRHHIKAANYI